MKELHQGPKLPVLVHQVQQAIQEVLQPQQPLEEVHHSCLLEKLVDQLRQNRKDLDLRRYPPQGELHRLLVEEVLQQDCLLLEEVLPAGVLQERLSPEEELPKDHSSWTRMLHHHPVLQEQGNCSVDLASSVAKSLPSSWMKVFRAVVVPCSAAGPCKDLTVAGAS